ncbi:hypothetical protein ABKN59_009586 [Abortiporus biennis]
MKLHQLVLPFALFMTMFSVTQAVPIQTDGSGGHLKPRVFGSFDFGGRLQKWIPFRSKKQDASMEQQSIPSTTSPSPPQLQLEQGEGEGHVFAYIQERERAFNEKHPKSPIQLSHEQLESIATLKCSVVFGGEGGKPKHTDRTKDVKYWVEWLHNPRYQKSKSFPSVQNGINSAIGTELSKLAKQARKSAHSAS